MNDLEKKVEDKMIEVLAKAEKQFKTNFTIPSIEYSKRLRCVGGKASYRHNRIILNFKMMLQNGEAFINEVVPHEICHLIEKVVFKTRGHGSNFYRIGQILGYPLKRCHSFKRVQPQHSNRSYLFGTPATSSCSVNPTISIKNLYHKLTVDLAECERIEDTFKNDPEKKLALRKKMTGLHDQRREMQTKYASILFKK